MVPLAFPSRLKKNGALAGSSVGPSIVPICPYTKVAVGSQSGHVKESTNEYVDRWNSTLMFLFLCPAPHPPHTSLSLTQKRKEKEWKQVRASHSHLTLSRQGSDCLITLLKSKIHSSGSSQLTSHHFSLARMVSCAHA